MTHTFTLATSKRNFRYGPHPDHRLNVYLNTVRLAGGNPVIIMTHGGALTEFDKTTQAEAGRTTIWLISYLLDNTGGSTVPFDVVSVEYRAWSHRLSANNYVLARSYEPQLDNPAIDSGHGAQSTQGYGLGFVDDVQLAWQWCADNAARFGWDSSKFIAWGYSYGGLASMLAAFSPSRPWDSKGIVPGMPRSEARVRAVLNYSGEVSVSPWVNTHETTRYLFGIASTVAADVRAQMEKLLLVPDASGLYPATVERNALCKALSPEDLIPVCTGEKKSIQIRSYYDVRDDTVVNVTGYSTIPPYGMNGHDYHQLARLQTACTTAGVTHTGGTYDSGAGGVNLQTAIEATLPSTYAWMVSVIS